RIGLVSKVVPDGRVVDAALETAALIRANSPFGVWMTKEVMWDNLEASSLQAAIDLENRTQLLSSYTGDMGEALAAFLEKRPAKYSGREQAENGGERQGTRGQGGARHGGRPWHGPRLLPRAGRRRRRCRDQLPP